MEQRLQRALRGLLGVEDGRLVDAGHARQVRDHEVALSRAGQRRYSSASKGVGIAATARRYRRGCARPGGPLPAPAALAAHTARVTTDDHDGRDAFSRALHRAAGARLGADPDAVLLRARHNLAVMRRANPAAEEWLAGWERLLDGPLDALLALLAAAGPDSRDLRQCSPFAGVLAPRERWAVLRRVREARGAT